jgi:hypothetical protein
MRRIGIFALFFSLFRMMTCFADDADGGGDIADDFLDDEQGDTPPSAKEDDTPINPANNRGDDKPDVPPTTKAGDKGAEFNEEEKKLLAQIRSEKEIEAFSTQIVREPLYKDFKFTEVKEELVRRCSSADGKFDRAAFSKLYNPESMKRVYLEMRSAPEPDAEYDYRSGRGNAGMGEAELAEKIRSGTASRFERAKYFGNAL